MNADRVERSVFLPVPPEDVWVALTQPDGLSAWFGANAQIQRLQKGARVEFSWPDGVLRAAILEEIDPPRRLSFRWLPFERTHDGTRARPATRVELSLDESEEGSLLTVVESDPRALGGLVTSVPGPETAFVKALP